MLANSLPTGCRKPTVTHFTLCPLKLIVPVLMVVVVAAYVWLLAPADREQAYREVDIEPFIDDRLQAGNVVEQPSLPLMPAPVEVVNQVEANDAGATAGSVRPVWSPGPIHNITEWPCRGCKPSSLEWSSDAVHVTEMYLESVKSAVTGYALRTPAVPYRAFEGNEVFDDQRRHAGEDEPKFGLTKMGMAGATLVQAKLQMLIEEGVDGDLLICGLWKGGIAVLTRALLVANHEADRRRLYIASSFGYAPSSLPRVHDTLRRFALDHPKQVQYVAGEFSRSLPVLHAQLENSLALLLINTAGRSQCLYALRTMYDKLSVGGMVLVVDDTGRLCFTAVAEFYGAIGVSSRLHIPSPYVCWWRKANDTVLLNSEPDPAADAFVDQRQTLDQSSVMVGQVDELPCAGCEHMRSALNKQADHVAFMRAMYVETVKATLTGYNIRLYDNNEGEERRQSDDAYFEKSPKLAYTDDGLSQLNVLHDLLGQVAASADLTGDYIDVGGWHAGAAVLAAAALLSSPAAKSQSFRIIMADDFNAVESAEAERAVDAFRRFQLYHPDRVKLVQASSEGPLELTLDTKARAIRINVARVGAGLLFSAYDLLAPGGWLLLDNCSDAQCSPTDSTFRQQYNITTSLQSTVHPKLLYWRKQ